MEQIKIPEYSYYPIPYLDIERYHFDTELLDNFTEQELKKYKFIPLEQIEKILTVCVAHPSLKLIQQLERQYNKLIRIFWCEEWKLLTIIKKHKGEMNVKQEILVSRSSV